LSTLTTLPRYPRLTLTFSAARSPQAVLAACIASQLNWEAWFNALFCGREFELVVEHDVVAVRVAGVAERLIVWKQEVRFMRRLTLTSPLTELLVQAPISRSVPLPSKTVAQEILQSDHEKEEADEIFALISRVTRDSFLNAPSTVLPLLPVTHITHQEFQEEIFHAGLPLGQPAFSPITSPESSRPSSPVSSAWSSLSQESLITPISPPPTSLLPTLLSFSRTEIASKAFVLPRPRSPPPYRLTATSLSSNVPAKVNTSTHRDVSANGPPKRVQRYLYRGGVSTTLTGGVFLGKTTSADDRAATTVSRLPKEHSFVPAAGVRTTRRPQQGSRLRHWRHAGVGHV
jgi:hypothetical protein